MRRTSSILTLVLALGLAACTSDVASRRPEQVAVPRELLSIGTQGGPLTVEVPTGSVLFERADALASPDGARVYSASVADGRTFVETDDATSGSVLSTISVSGEHALGVVSGSGHAVALVDPLPKGWDPAVPVPRSRTDIVVADPTGAAEPRTFRLRGNYEPEAFSVDDGKLFLIQHLPAEAPAVYRVTMLDLVLGDVFPVFGPYKGPPERMPGTRLEQILAPNADRLYTLYSSSRPGYAPHDAPVPANATVSFVHVLDLVEGWAHCVGLPEQLWKRPASEQAMAASPDGATLYVVDPAVGVVVAMDTTTLETRVVDQVPFGTPDGASASAQVSADGGTLFVAASGTASTLFALETSSFEIASRWSLDAPVSGLGLSADGGRLYVANPDRVDVVDPLTGARLADVPFASPGPILRLEPIAGLTRERSRTRRVREDGGVRLPVMPPVAPMLAKSVKDIPAGAFLYEPKWDGFRSIVFRDGDEVEIGSRNERPMTRYFPEVVVAILANLPGRCVVDGEIVVPDADGRRLEFETLQQRIHPADSRVRMLAERTPAHFVAFDLLALGDRDVTREPFAERRRALEEALAGARPPVHLTPATTDLEVAERWFHQFEGAGLDGVVAKPLDGTYQPDKRVMFKIKHERTADCVVAGYRLHKGSTDAIGSLLLGLYDDGGRPGQRRRRRGPAHGASPGAVRGAPAAGHDLRGPPLELGRARDRGPHAPALRVQPVERREGPVLRAASSGAGARGPLRAHGGHALPPHGPVLALAPRPRPALLHVRAAGGAGPLRPLRDPAPRVAARGSRVRPAERPCALPRRGARRPAARGRRRCRRRTSSRRRSRGGPPSGRSGRASPARRGGTWGGPAGSSAARRGASPRGRSSASRTGSGRPSRPRPAPRPPRRSRTRIAHVAAESSITACHSAARPASSICGGVS